MKSEEKKLGKVFQAEETACVLALSTNSHVMPLMPLVAPFSAFWIPQMIPSTYLPCIYLDVPLGPAGVVSHQQLNQWGVQGDPVQAKGP